MRLPRYQFAAMKDLLRWVIEQAGASVKEVQEVSQRGAGLPFDFGGPLFSRVIAPMYLQESNQV